MKTLKKLILTLFVSTMIFSCIDDDNDELTGNAALGGLVDVGNPLISYVVGSGNTYSAAGAVFQANVQTTEVPWYLWFVGGLFSVIGIAIYFYNIPPTSINFIRS